ncbi:MAG: hydratase [Pyramidobacter sp.]
MMTLIDRPVTLFGGKALIEEPEKMSPQELRWRLEKQNVRYEGKLPLQSGEGTMVRRIMESHSLGREGGLFHMKFDALTSHDITYVAALQTAVACGLKEFPVPYVLTNCHNSLCAVGGTINEDDHMFGLTAAQKFGGIFVPRHLAVIHQYMRECFAKSGGMILGTDSHTRYGALGTLSVGEGGPEMVKQLLGRTYDIRWPGVIAVYLTGAPRPGVGPHDVAIALIGAVFKNGFVKNKALEFVGPGVAKLSAEFRMGVDVMTTETACWSSLWRTDETVARFFEVHNRPQDYARLDPAEAARYDGAVVIDLSYVEPMIAVPFHPSNAYTIAQFQSNAPDILHEAEVEARRLMDNPDLEIHMADKFRNGKFYADQGVICGCAGGNFENLVAAAQILDGEDMGNGAFSLSVYPSSMPVGQALMNGGWMQKLVAAGAVNYPAFCGPCFGAGETPCNAGFSIRHTTRNFPNRDGSKPNSGQWAAVALMDARSIAATAARGGVLTSAFQYAHKLKDHEAYSFDGRIYARRVYNGFGHGRPEVKLQYGPNIKPWPKIAELPENQLLLVASVIDDPVTTTDELIPSGETSSLRSNPMKLAEFTLQRKDPHYVPCAKKAKELETARAAAVKNGAPLPAEADRLLKSLGIKAENVGFGSLVCAVKPGDGSAREQAASSQKMLGGQANVAEEYATKRYRSNLVNWGMAPWIVSKEDRAKFRVGQWLFIPEVRKFMASPSEKIEAQLIDGTEKISVTLALPGIAEDERQMLLAGCLMNAYGAGQKKRAE